ncbi:MAG: F0F1 ATP synthase subunit A [Chloroflexi bacterium]|nr:F0F1 ATP synthase subunit A [Chloroflexota bacterium]
MKQTFPYVVFTIFGIPVRRTVIVTWMMMAVLTILAYLTSRRMSLKPKGWQRLVELGIEALEGLISRTIGRPGEEFLPLVGTLILFIATANLSGLVPGLSSPTSDINTPFALALVVFFAVHYYGIRQQGLAGYIKLLAGPVFVSLPLELMGHVSRVISLSLRLFGNMVAGTVIVAVLYGLIPLIIPIPLLLFNLLIGVLQAFVFTLLSIVYIGQAVKPLAEER